MEGRGGFGLSLMGFRVRGFPGNRGFGFGLCASACWVVSGLQGFRWSFETNSRATSELQSQPSEVQDPYSESWVQDFEGSGFRALGVQV